MCIHEELYYVVAMQVFLKMWYPDNDTFYLGFNGEQFILQLFNKSLQWMDVNIDITNRK